MGERRNERGGLWGLVLFTVVAGCEGTEPGSPAARPPLVVVPECEFDVQTLAPDDRIGPHSAQELAEQLSGEYRILITWIETGGHTEVRFSLAVHADSMTRREPINADCNKPLSYVTPYELLENESRSEGHFVILPIVDHFPRLEHPLRTGIVPENAFPPDVVDPGFQGRGWQLDRIELVARWHPSVEGTVATGKISAWYERSEGESTITSTPLGIAAIYPEASFHDREDEQGDEIQSILTAPPT